MRFRSAGSLGPAQIGKRVTIRVRDADGRARDILGTLTALDERSATVERDAGGSERVELGSIVAAREVGSRKPRAPRRGPS